MAELLHTIERETGPNPTATLIVLHGLGADGHDFVPFMREVDLGAAGPVRWIFPNAPERPVTLNGGHVMRAWYDIFGLDTREWREDDAGLRASQAQVEALIAREKQRGVPASRIVLAGFSQGCAMTLMCGLRHDERLAGLVGMSGYLPLAAKSAAERHPANADVPIFMAHGTQDPVIPMARARQSKDVLVQMGHDVDWHEYGMAHSVCGEEVVDLRRWLLARLAPQAAGGA